MLIKRLISLNFVLCFCKQELHKTSIQNKGDKNYENNNINQDLNNNTYFTYCRMHSQRYHNKEL